MSVPPETVDFVREEGKRRRRLRRIERKRNELAGIVDTGNLSNEDVEVLWAAYTGAKDQPVEDVNR